jgi:hypothetical protein
MPKAVVRLLFSVLTALMRPPSLEEIGFAADLEIEGGLSQLFGWRQDQKSKSYA